MPAAGCRVSHPVPLLPLSRQHVACCVPRILPQKTQLFGQPFTSPITLPGSRLPINAAFNIFVPSTGKSFLVFHPFVDSATWRTVTGRLRAQHRGAGLGALPHHGKLPASREEAELPAASLVPQAQQGTAAPPGGPRAAGRLQASAPGWLKWLKPLSPQNKGWSEVA